MIIDIIHRRTTMKLKGLSDKAVRRIADRIKGQWSGYNEGLSVRSLFR